MVSSRSFWTFRLSSHQDWSPDVDVNEIFWRKGDHVPSLLPKDHSRKTIAGESKCGEGFPNLLVFFLSYLLSCSTSGKMSPRISPWNCFLHFSSRNWSTGSFSIHIESRRVDWSIKKSQESGFISATFMIFLESRVYCCRIQLHFLWRWLGENFFQAETIFCANVSRSYQSWSASFGSCNVVKRRLKLVVNLIEESVNLQYVNTLLFSVYAILSISHSALENRDHLWQKAIPTETQNSLNFFPNLLSTRTLRTEMEFSQSVLS